MRETQSLNNMPDLTASQPLLEDPATEHGCEIVTTPADVLTGFTCSLCSREGRCNLSGCSGKHRFFPTAQVSASISCMLPPERVSGPQHGVGGGSQFSESPAFSMHVLSHLAGC